MKMNFFIKQSVLLVMAIILIIQIGCKDSNPVPEPVKKKYVWAVGNQDSTQYAQIFFSADGGENWVRQGNGQPSLKDIDLNDVWAVDDNTVWAVSGQNVVLKTDDSGKNWYRVQLPTNRSDVELCSISLIGNDNIWISGARGIVFHSADAGNNWRLVQSPVLNNTFLQNIHAITDQMIYVAGTRSEKDYGFIARTYNGGQTWDSIRPTDNFNNKREWIGVASSNRDNIIIYGSTSHYIYSNDGGHNWRNDSTGISGGNGYGGPDINDLIMLDSQTWWSALDYDNIGFTNEAGSSNWKNQGPPQGPGGSFLVGIDSYNTKLCVIVGETAGYPQTGSIFQTSDGGQSWKLKVSTNGPMNKVSFIK